MIIDINSKEDWEKFGNLIESGLNRSKARWLTKQNSVSINNIKNNPVKEQIEDEDEQIL